MSALTSAALVAAVSVLVATPVVAADQQGGEIDEASAIALAKRRCSIMEHGMERDGPWNAARKGDTWIVTLHDEATFEVQSSEGMAPILGVGRHCVKTSIRAEVGVQDGRVHECAISDNLACP